MPVPSISRPRSVALITSFAFLTGSLVQAAKAPVDQAHLEQESVLIVTGTVLDVTSKDEKSKIEKGFGWHTDRIFTVKLRVESIEKENGSVKSGDEITIRVWRPVRRIPAMPGLQGHTPIPAKGDRITAYIKSIDGAVHQPFLPNGVEIHEPDSPAAE